MTIAAISLMRRRDDVPLHTFGRHWLDVRGPLVCKVPSLRHYLQCHVLASHATNAVARAMRIDGFPILLFDNDTDRQQAYNCAAMAACTEDSKSFIGAVAPVIAQQDDIVPGPDTRGRMRLIVLYPESIRGSVIAADLDRLRAMPHLHGLRCYSVLQQGRAPNSVIPYLQVTAAALAQA